jgi:hypothetical protein
MFLRSIMMACLILMGVVCSVQSQTPSYVVSQDDFYQTVTNAVAFDRPVLENTLRKTGAGILTLQNPRMPRAAMEVVEGGVEISLTNIFVNPQLPAALQSKAAFWVDANTNVVADGGGVVSRWHDVRESLVDGPYSYMMATNAEVARQPTVVSDAGLGGKKYLDFGYWGDQTTNVNSRWLFWADANGVSKTLLLRSVFIVFGSHNGYTSAGGGIMLIQNSTSLAAPTAPFAGGSDRLWIDSVNVVADDAINYLDRQILNGKKIQIKDTAYHLIECATLQSARANTFAKDRTYPGYSGGSRICEGLFFTEELTDAERLQVQEYLWHKWFSRSGESSLGTVALGNGATLDLLADTNDVELTVSGDGIVSKSGSGTVALMNGGTYAFDGTVRLEEGNLLIGGESFLFGLEEGGQTLFAQDIFVNRSSASAGSVVKTGSGELAVASVDPSVTQISVTDGTLRLVTPRVADAVQVANGVVNEHSLEIFDPGGTVNYINYTPFGAPVTTVNDWRFDRTAYTISGGFLLGVAFEDPRSGSLIGEGLVPDGNTVLYINRGLVETDFTVPAAGIYRLSFYAAARGGNFNRHVEVQIDGVTIRTIITPSTAFWKHEITLPHLTAGAHTIGFEGIGTTLTEFGRVAYIDDIQISTVQSCETAPVLALMTNAGFEMPLSLIEAGTIVINEPTGSGWTFTGLAGLGRIQSINANPRKMPMRVPDGTGAAFLPLTGSIRQDVTFPTSGVYRLSFSTAARLGLLNQSYNVLLDGELVSSVTTTDRAFKRVELMLPPVTTGAVLELAFVGTGVMNQISLIDDVRIERVEEDLAVDALKNGGFELVTSLNPLVPTNWVCTSLAGSYSNVNAWGESVPYGTYFGYTSMTHSFLQTVTFAESGNYAVRFLTKTRDAYALADYHDFKVTLNGELVGHICNMDDALRSYELPLPPITAGVPYELKFKGLQSYTNDNTLSIYDQIAIVPAPAPRARQSVTGRFPESLALEVDAGADLVLDFDGEIALNEVRYDGHIVSGAISAATCPDFISGSGSIYSAAKGTMILLR